MKKSALKAQDADAKPYEPTQAEAKALAAYEAAKDAHGPRLKVSIEGNGAKLNPDHPDEIIGLLTLMRSIGTADLDFFDGLMLQLVNASKGGGPLEKAVNFMLAVVKGIEPRDQVEAMLAAQMAAVHNATMTFAQRLAHVETIPQQDSAQNAFNKLARTFAAQVEALKRYRSGGEQKMTVQHVHVAEGGQAIVGNVNAPAEGAGSAKNLRINLMKRSELPMRQACRCSARSKRTGKPCRSPAVRGYSVCRMHGAGGGAPAGNRNAFKHGHYTAEAIEMRRVVAKLTRQARETMDAIE